MKTNIESDKQIEQTDRLSDEVRSVRQNKLRYTNYKKNWNKVMNINELRYRLSFYHVLGSNNSSLSQYLGHTNLTKRVVNILKHLGSKSK